jgi:TrmH family RNA methyltransferase
VTSNSTSAHEPTDPPPRRRGASNRYGSARGKAPEGDPGRAALARVSVVLVEPQGPRNVGSTCRAMKNFGLDRLVLVNPAVVDHPEAREMASGAGDLLRAARIVPTYEEALQGVTLAVGTTARPRHRIPVRTPAKAAAEIVEHAAAGGEVALVFGREANGLTQDELLRCQRAISIETAPEYGSLNLAQAVLLVAYELFRASRSIAAKGQGWTGRFLTVAWRDLLEEELWRALIKMKALHPANASADRESLGRVLASGPMQTRDVRVLFALARHAQKLADPADPGTRPPRRPSRQD